MELKSINSELKQDQKVKEIGYSSSTSHVVYLLKKCKALINRMLAKPTVGEVCLIPKELKRQQWTSKDLNRLNSIILSQMRSPLLPAQ